MKAVFILFLLFVSTTLFTQDAVIQNYIESYKDVAIEEMYRTGIPASIKLAQAVLESNAGRSELSTGASNHFGMKCGPAWEGDEFYRKDDDRDRKGRLIKSCFRVYDSPIESFIAHSEFLMNPAKAYRYGTLFDIPRTDYKSWAWGLKKAGYATNPKYANLLISLIEMYHLYTYDYYERNDIVHLTVEQLLEKNHYQTSKATHTRLDDHTVKALVKESYTPLSFERKRKVIKNNGVKMIYAFAGDTPEKIARDLGILSDKIIEYNEHIVSSQQSLIRSEYIYLEKKKRKYKGGRKHHLVLEGESMHSIAQKYGIELNYLHMRNRLEPGLEPALGSKLVLRGMIKEKHRPAIRPDKSVFVKNVLDKPIYNAPAAVEYIVKQGDTLYAIAKMYQTDVDTLKVQNQLASNEIFPGQKIVIP